MTSWKIYPNGTLEIKYNDGNLNRNIAIKSPVRAFYKTEFKYGGTRECLPELKDLSRNTMVFETSEDLQAGLDYITKTFIDCEDRPEEFKGTQVKYVKNGWAAYNPETSIYVDVKVIFETQFDGGIGGDGIKSVYSEVIFLTRAMEEKKYGLHAFYDVARTINPPKGGGMFDMLTKPRIPTLEEIITNPLVQKCKSIQPADILARMQLLKNESKPRRHWRQARWGAKRMIRASAVAKQSGESGDRPQHELTSSEKDAM